MGMDVCVHLGMCLLMPFLPSCPLKIYLELKQAGRVGQERLFPQRGGNRTQAPRAAPVVPISTASILHFPEHPKPPVISSF